MYQVQKLLPTGEWEKVQDFKLLQEAENKCAEIVGGNIYTEPYRGIAKGYWGNDLNDKWICMIERL